MTTARNLASFGNIVGGLVGELKMWPTGTAPTGYLLCNGALVSRTTYATLFAVLGTTYGPGDGSTTFNLPNFKDRMPIGAGTTYSANTTGGSADAIIPSHTHTATDSGHSHSYAVWFDASGNHTQYGSDVGQPYGGAGSNKTSVSASASISVGSTGVSATNANLPPYIGIHFIIRYL
jgi:microcystin-dependent protein